MANQEQLKILMQGADVWNKWREDNLDIQIDLAEANLTKIVLWDVNLSNVNLNRANLWMVELIGANLSESSFDEANLKNAILNQSDLSYASFIRADLCGADLTTADLSGANLTEANLSKSSLSGSNFRETNLKETNLKEANISITVFGSIDLSETIGLEEVRHGAPSSIDTQTLQLSKGKIPEAFLRGCGLADWEIESSKLHNPDLTNEEIVKIQYRMFDLRATQALQISPLFISYSHTDKPFVDHLDSSLTKKGIRFWRDIHDATAGRLETQIDRAIRQNPTVLLILSKNSIKSDWVEHEVRKARALEKELGRDALCPVALDDGWKSSPWPERVMEQIMEYNILDFSGWEDTSTFEYKFAKLLGGLEIFYKKSK